jgi:thioredoxin-like negative regulator of GroEL
MTHRVKEKMETREVIVLTAPWCDSCDEFLEDIQRACDFSEMEFIQVDEGSSKYNSHVNRYHVYTLPALIVTSGASYKKYEGRRGIQDFLILYLDE